MDKLKFIMASFLLAILLLGSDCDQDAVESPKVSFDCSVYDDDPRACAIQRNSLNHKLCKWYRHYPEACFLQNEASVKSLCNALSDSNSSVCTGEGCAYYAASGTLTTAPALCVAPGCNQLHQCESYAPDNYVLGRTGVVSTNPAIANRFCTYQPEQHERCENIVFESP